jgi:glycosyltransferase involved in cell wall biosynthesis
MELLDDPALRRRMGQVGLERVRQELNWEHSRRALLDAYRHLSGAFLQEIAAEQERKTA